MKKKKVFSTLNTLIAIAFMSVAATATAIFSVVKATLVINEDTFFTYVEPTTNYEYHCYSIEGESSKIAISWGMAPSATPTNLTVPSTVSNGVANFTVSAIAKHGFRYCDFETISLPTTIEEIREEAFAYCESLTRFTLPYLVSEIAPSTFIDCRNLAYFFYSNSSGIDLLTNDTVTRIGDHAFDSCISLTDFNCSTKLTYFGESCFQNCETIGSFYFPSKTGTGENVNKITVKSYAFADCQNLNWIYFEENLDVVEPYAFVDCASDAVLHFGYYSSPFTPDSKYDTNWRKKIIDTKNSDLIPIENDHIVILQSNDFPGLRYTIESNDVYLDCQRANPKTIKIINGGNTENDKYAVIYQWNAPIETVTYKEDPTDPTSRTLTYYNTTTKALRIPGSVTFDGHEYPLKVIKAETFKDKTEYIHSVTFSDGLVQICNRAFYRCNQISSLDFSECTTLKEISNGIFSDAQTYQAAYANTLVTTLTLPNSLQFLGKYAFFNFRKLSSLSFKTDPNQPSDLRVLGGYSFGNIGMGYAENINNPVGKLDISLPCSLNDAQAKEANINFVEKHGSADNYNEANFAGVGPYAFGSQSNNEWTCVRTITMDEPTAAQAADLTYTCSLCSNAFNRCRALSRFFASDNLCLVGADAFKNCGNLREIFLTTRKANAYVTRTGKQYPWGTKDEGSNPDNSLFSGVAMPNLVIYVDGAAPGRINDLTTNKNIFKWNTESAFSLINELGYTNASNENSLTRTSVPTFYNADLSSILYFKPSNRTFLSAENYPKLVSDYEQGIISFVKQGNKYIVSKYYTSDANRTDEIDLTGITHGTDDISANLTAVGAGAFSANGNGRPGLYFILPDAVTEIGERAFYRKATDGGSNVAVYGVRIVTYKTGGSIQGSSSYSYADAKGSHGYCKLPNTVTRIDRDAFYDNCFESAEIGNGLAYLGSSAFYTHFKNTSKLASITFGTSSYFTVTNNGIYYTANANKKMLLYQAQNISSTLTIDSGTKAIGLGACANTKYSSITLNSDLTHIYGMGFKNNYFLQTVTVPANSSIKYISAYKSDDNVYDDSLPFNNIDYREHYLVGSGLKQNHTSAFSGCDALTTFNFKNLTNVVAIGYAAFNGCSALTNMTGGAFYNYYEFNGTSNVALETGKSTGVLDLSGCSNLVNIAARSFSGCSGIKYVHLPSNSNLYVSKNPTGYSVLETDKEILPNNGVKILVGETASQACYNYSSATNHAKGHYSSGAYNGNTPYYYAATTDDVLEGSGNDLNICYWTLENGNYILISGYTNAKAYFAAHSS